MLTYRASTGGHGEGGRGGHGGGSGERPKKENILDLGKYMDKQITVKFTGGREGICPVITYDAKLPYKRQLLILSSLPKQ